MGNEGGIIAARVLEIAMAHQTAGVEDILFSVREAGLPVDGVKVVGELRPQIVKTEPSLGPEIACNVIVAQVTVGALRSETAGVVSAVNIVSEGAGEWLHGVAGRAEVWARARL